MNSTETDSLLAQAEKYLEAERSRSGSAIIERLMLALRHSEAMHEATTTRLINRERELKLLRDPRAEPVRNRGALGYVSPDGSVRFSEHICKELGVTATEGVGIVVLKSDRDQPYLQILTDEQFHKLLYPDSDCAEHE